ncbi:cytochrome c oxidase assembly protein [Alginatibacterium sediminis]|uniref:Cytochrome c oxidase assembly protein CtaG n=1 Tax=Alginatibacterium sediminis TaxID=2164068 RepID=A0A420E604_9ALTE|nr:cytochrome c oxidase assembly protein [Alginatibacterium sediminis]RKF13140.1 cytochrome c oxidase assembly protein [Alginatibacterium sediminis]
MGTNARLVSKLSIAVVLMFGFGYALVPLYDVFCKITGINGKTEKQASAVSTNVDQQRLINVEFITYVNKDLAWDFDAVTQKVSVHPGESITVNFSATNLSHETTVVQAVPSVSPGRGASYLKKVSCFCFEQQSLAAGESVDMPLLFYVSPDLPSDISTLTLAYTMFPISGAQVNVSTNSQEVSNDATL